MRGWLGLMSPHGVGQWSLSLFVIMGLVLFFWIEVLCVVWAELPFPFFLSRPSALDHSFTSPGESVTFGKGDLNQRLVSFRENYDHFILSFHAQILTLIDYLKRTW